MGCIQTDPHKRAQYRAVLYRDGFIKAAVGSESTGNNTSELLEMGESVAEALYHSHISGYFL